MDAFETEQIELSDVCAALAEKMGITYEPYTYKGDKNCGARLAIVHLSYKLAEQCGENLYGARSELEPRLSPEATKHLMSRPSDIAEKTFISIYKYHPENSHFLDLGCGSGFVVSLGLKLGYDSYGVDINPGIVRQAQENLKRLYENPDRIVLGDFFKSEFWVTPIDGRKPSEFDFFYLHNEWDIMEKAFPIIVGNMRKDSHLILSYIPHYIHFTSSYLEGMNLKRENSSISIMFGKKG